MTQQLNPTHQRSMRERMLAADHRRAIRLLEQFNSSSAVAPEVRKGLLRDLPGTLGLSAVIRLPLYCDYGYQTHLGAPSFASFGLVALDVARISIGEDVQIGPNVQLLTATDPLEAELRRAEWEAARPITIGNNVWPGGGVIVCSGVTIGDNAVVGAGAVMVKDLPANEVAAGNPVRVIRRL